MTEDLQENNGDTTTTTIKIGHEEEDAGCYFLQPSSSPYNITEKVQQANFDLFNSTPEASRSFKVKFREELVSFEPDLTDDDVNSIESDHVAEVLHTINIETEYQEINATNTKLPYNTVLRGGMDIYDIEEEILDETVMEELVLSDDNEDNISIENEDIENEEKHTPTTPNEKEPSNDGSSKRFKANSETYTISSRKSSKKKKLKTFKKQEIHCKDHCIEKLDSHLSMSIKKLEIHEKPLMNLPPLQLHQRKCCDETKLSNSNRNLPNYNGYRSEYGLSSRQIKNRDRYLEMIRQKEMARQKLMEEYRALKVQQNEQVFCQWLKEVSRRNKEQNIKNHLNRHGNKSASPQMSQNCLSPNVVNFDKSGKLKERPKTAGFIPKTNIKKKKRPHTTQSCVYIELSPNILKKGIHIGDLLITNSKELSKKVHILTVS